MLAADVVVAASVAVVADFTAVVDFAAAACMPDASTAAPEEFTVAAVAMRGVRTHRIR
jgi:hypothetical protein